MQHSFTDIILAVVAYFDYKEYDIGMDYLNVQLNEPARTFINLDFDADVQGICSVSVDNLNIDKMDFTYIVYGDMSAEDLIQEIIDFIEENT